MLHISSILNIMAEGLKVDNRNRQTMLMLIRGKPPCLPCRKKGIYYKCVQQHGVGGDCTVMQSQTKTKSIYLGSYPETDGRSAGFRAEESRKE
jgi:hypothetical protein